MSTYFKLWLFKKALYIKAVIKIDFTSTKSDIKLMDTWSYHRLKMEQTKQLLVLVYLFSETIASRDSV